MRVSIDIDYGDEEIQVIKSPGSLAFNNKISEEYQLIEYAIKHLDKAHAQIRKSLRDQAEALYQKGI